jgi:hypothetical protein
VIGQTQNFSARIAVKGLLCATVLALVLIEALVLVSSARASVATVQSEAVAPTQEPGSPTGGAGAPGEGAAGGESGTPAEGEATSSEGTPPAEQTPPPVETSPPVEGSLPVEPTTPAESSTPAEVTPVQTTPTETTSTEQPKQQTGEGAVEEVVHTTKETVAQGGELLAPVAKEAVVTASEIVVPGAPVEERVKPAESAKEATQAEAVAAPIVAGSPPAPPGTPDAAILTTFPAIAVAEAQERATRSRAVTVGWLTAAQRAGEISCELSGLTRGMSEDCSVGFLSGSSLIAVDSAEAAGEVSPVRKSAHPGGGYSEPAGGGRSGGAPPGPPPGGAFGGSAAAGSGIALSGFFTLAGLLLFAAPCAMRRLRLSCRPWRTAFFVLIPERPG